MVNPQNTLVTMVTAVTMVTLVTMGTVVIWIIGGHPHSSDLTDIIHIYHLLVNGPEFFSLLKFPKLF
jgi:hypothetical protein